MCVCVCVCVCVCKMVERRDRIQKGAYIWICLPFSVGLLMYCLADRCIYDLWSDSCQTALFGGTK